MKNILFSGKRFHFFFICFGIFALLIFLEGRFQLLKLYDIDTEMYRKYLYGVGIGLFALVLGYYLIGLRFENLKLSVPYHDVRYKKLFIKNAENSVLDESKFHYLTEISLTRLYKHLRIEDRKYIAIMVLSPAIPAILLAILYSVDSSDPILSEINELYLITFFQALLIIALSVVVGIFWFFIKKKLEPEFILLLTSNKAKLSFIAGISLYSLLGYLSFENSWISIEAFLFGLLILFMFIIVAQLEGSFIGIFALFNWYQFKNWDILEGKRVKKKDGGFNSIKGLRIRIFALTAILMIPLGILSLFLNWINIFVSSNPIIDFGYLNTFLSGIPGPSSFYLLLIGLGPFLIILVKPLNYIDIWLHQGLYNKIGSDWSIEEFNNNIKTNRSPIKIPNYNINFSDNVVLITWLVITLLALTSISTVMSNLFPEVGQAIWLATRAGEFVFILNIIFVLKSLKEERTLNLFAKYSKENDRDFINEALYCEYKLATIEKDLSEYRDFVASQESNWGLPNFYLGLYYEYIQNSKESKKYYKKALEQKLPDKMNHEVERVANKINNY